MATTLSPVSSPRLPSPPPIAEDQTGPASPGIALFDDHSKSSAFDSGVSRRIRPGTKAEDITDGPPLVELSELDSAFQLTEHVKALHHSFTHPNGSNSTIPVTAEFAREFSRPPPNTSREIWLYELGRFLIQKTNSIIVALFADYPPCSAQTCPEMRASEWQYLCAVHDPPKSCSAIDYCCHTLDWAATTLTSSKMFPSRLGLGSGNTTGGSDKVLQQQLKEITNIFRRVYRIYAHAWFQHRDMFWRVEGKTGLYILFKTVCDEYGMIQPENYTIPPEAEGLEPELTPQEAEPLPPLNLLRREADVTKEKSAEAVGNSVVATGDTTKRHRHTRSDIPTALTTSIQEETEEDEDTQAKAKPGLERQGTAVKEATEAKDEQKEASDESGDGPPASGLSRSDTIKAPKELEAAEAEDVTVIEAGQEPLPEPSSTTDSEATIAIPTTEEPAELKSAAKSVHAD